MHALSRIDFAGLIGNTVTEVGIVKTVAGNEIDGSAEQDLQSFFEREISVCVLGRWDIIEFNQEIEITRGEVKVGTKNGTEYPEDLERGSSLYIYDLFGEEKD